ncbi:hypothetical protein PIB30_010972 [Stylosanthes scabra]|uniref:Transmembrane protein n=1 Tax=Stylosanthes scabra TaxID=79078 RepID=A0ABU6V4Q6_9FABA|nr:hypothetical protein [Stylosanthes scabra]
MARFTPLLQRPSITILIPASTPLLSRRNQFLSFPLHSPKPQRFLVFTANNNNNKEEENEVARELEDKKDQQPSGSNGVESEGEDDSKNFSKERRGGIFSLSWNSIFDPDPDNVLALGLTGILTWASVQVLWQLLFISFAILVAALKYSFIAAILLFILITLL